MVISVISILAALLFVAVKTAGQSSFISATKSTIAEVATALEFYRQSRDVLPPETYPGPKMASSESLAYHLGVAETFVQLKKVATADTDGDGGVELLDAWAQPLVYNRWHFSGDPTEVFIGGDDFADYMPIHNPKSFDLFSVGQQANHISGLAPTPATVANLEFDKNATANPPTRDRYVREEIKVAGSKKPNKYIGNW